MKPSTHTALPTDQISAYADLTSAILELNIPVVYRAGVIVNLERLLELGDLVMGFPLPDDMEAAPVFQP